MDNKDIEKIRKINFLKRKKQNKGDKGDDVMAALDLAMNEKIDNRISIQQIEKMLGFDKIEPIRLANSDLQDRENKDEDFSDWYEKELRHFYENL